jgi:nicotinamide-nucleotide amidase
MSSRLSRSVSEAGIISIGDELLVGQVVNTNAAFIEQQLNGIGITVHKVLTIGDDESEILEALGEYFERFDVTIMTGGLGPTHDDLTRSVLCRFFDTDLVRDESSLANIREIMERRNIPWTSAAEEQALVPRGCTVLPNKLGTAPGLMFERDGKYVIALAGVPYEMEALIRESVVPFFKTRASGRVIRHRTLKTTGIPESFLAMKLGKVEELVHDAKLAFLPSPGGVRLRITASGASESTVEKVIREAELAIRQKAEKYIYGVDDEELEEVVGRVLTENKLKIAVAESCTGGMIAHRITNVPGSSAYFERAIVAYSNRSKIELLGVPKRLIEEHGAVSRGVAEAMAEGVRKIDGVDIGISTTGIAGPSGGTPEKPVGLVWIGYSDSSETIALRFNFGDERKRFKERASQAALELLRRKLLKLETSAAE